MPHARTRELPPGAEDTLQSQQGQGTVFPQPQGTECCHNLNGLEDHTPQPPDRSPGPAVAWVSVSGNSAESLPRPIPPTELLGNPCESVTQKQMPKAITPVTGEGRGWEWNRKREQYNNRQGKHVPKG